MKFISTIILVFTIMNSYGQKIDLNEQLVAEYKFDNNVSDSGPFSLNGIINGDVTFNMDRFNNPNGACYFDGDFDYIIIPENSLLDFSTDNFAISFWFRTSDSNTQMVIMKGNDDPPKYSQYWFRLNGWFDDVAMQFLTGDNSPPSSKVGAMPGEVINDNVWHHIVCQREEETMSIYSDGVLLSSTLQTIENVNNDFDMIIGAQFPRAENNYHHFFHGFIDELRIYHRALNDCEIEALYTGIYPGER